MAALLESADLKVCASPMIQNELLDICGDQIRKGGVDRCNAASFYGFIANEAIDCSIKEQIALCVRFWIKIQERFVKSFLDFRNLIVLPGNTLLISLYHQN
jgi:hypothetical protein